MSQAAVERSRGRPSPGSSSRALAVLEGFVLVVQILTGHIVFRNLARTDLRDTGIFRVFYPVHSVSFESIPFFSQFFDTLRVGGGDIWQLLIGSVPERGGSVPGAFACSFVP
jgi:hypothetical protein